MPDHPHAYDPDLRRPDPNRKLQQLSTELKRKQAEIDTLTKQTTDLQTDIDGLKATVAEVTTVLSTYADNITKLRKDRDDLEFFLEQKSKMVAAAVGDKKEAIDQIVRGYDSVLQEQAQRVGELGEREGEVEEEYNEAAERAQDRQQQYDTSKAAQQNITNYLTEMKSLREQIVSADDKTDVPSMYFLVLEMRHVMQHTHIPSQGQLSDSLNEALSGLEEAKEHARTRQASWNSLKLEHDTEKTKLDDLKTNRRKDILSAIQAQWPPQSTEATAATK